MLRVFALTLAVVAGASCMKMRETVERTVMVRTSGSDLHPAATGYIYKKQNDGEEKVIRMGESEVMEELSRLYAAPKPYVLAPNKKANLEKIDENKAESKNDERIIPVKEKAEDEHNDHIDGIADDEDDYKKIFDKHTAHYGENTSYEDYLKGLGHFDDGIYKGYYGDSNEDSDGYKGYKNQKYYNNGAGDYQNGKYESYSYTGKKDDDRQHYDNRNHNDADDHKGALAKQKTGAYYKVFSKDESYKGHGSYGDGGKTSHSFGDGGKHHGAGGGHDEDGSHESGDHKHAHSENDNDKQGSNHSAEESSQEKPGDFASDGGHATGNLYGYEIQH